MIFSKSFSSNFPPNSESSFDSRNENRVFISNEAEIMAHKFRKKC